MTGAPGHHGPFEGIAAQLAGAAPAGQAAAGRSSGLPPGARYLGRFLRLHHALVAHGVPVDQAAALAGRNRKPKPAEVQHQLPADAPCLAGCALIVRRMPGNHAEAWAVVIGAASSAGPAPAQDREATR